MRAVSPIFAGTLLGMAAAEIEGNIARGKAIWAADQATYVGTGKVPRQSGACRPGR
jgi:hypothetical protein